MSSSLRRWLRFGGVALQLFAGLAVVTAVYPCVGRSTRQRLKQRWSLQLLARLGITLDRRGEIGAGALLCANHISWVDIFVINATQPTAFVAKSEVRGWPLIGALAAKTETLFIERGRSRHALHIAHRMASLLAAGRNVAVFPEGTTSDGCAVLPFHAALLQPAISAGAPVQPLAIVYRDAAGRRSTAPAYVGDMSFLASLRNILSTRGLRAEIHCLPVIVVAGRTRRELAAAAEAAIRARVDRTAFSAESLR